MITKITGKVVLVVEDQMTLEIPPFEYQVLIPEFVRRQVQQRIGETVTLHTMQYLEGNPMQGRVIPRMIGFTTDVEREFFDLFCSVDGVGVRKALKALGRAVKDIAVAIQQQDKASLSTLPGIGEATSERIIAKLRRKVAKFALIVQSDGEADVAEVQPDVVQDAYAALTSVGHSEVEARQLIDRALQGKKKYRTTVDLLDVIFKEVTDAS